MSSSGISGLDSSVLLGYYQSQLNASPSAIAAGNRVAAQSSNKPNATSADNPPWNTPNTNDAKQDAAVLSTTNFLNTSKVPLSPGATPDAKMEQDNQKLFVRPGAVLAHGFTWLQHYEAGAHGRRLRWAVEDGQVALALGIQLDHLGGGVGSRKRG